MEDKHCENCGSKNEIKEYKNPYGTFYLCNKCAEIPVKQLKDNFPNK